jgi:hypothetical protein
MTDLVEEVMCGTTPALDDEENAYQEFLPQDNVIEDEEDNDISDDEPDLDEDADIVNDPAFHVGIGFNEDKDRLPPDDEEDALFDEAPAFSGKSKHKPTKVLPYVAPCRAIQHWLLRPGKYQELQQWRQDGDEPRQVPATHAQGENAFADPSYPMHDMHDAWGWCTICAGLQHVYYDNGQLRVLNDNVHNLQQRFVSFPCGLVWHINLDWYVIHPLPDIKGSHHTVHQVPGRQTRQSLHGGTLHDLL